MRDLHRQENFTKNYKPRSCQSDFLLTEDCQFQKAQKTFKITKKANNFKSNGTLGTSLPLGTSPSRIWVTQTKH